MELTGQALRLSRQGAQAIVEEVGAIVGQHINMMDPEGYVIASTDPERIGTLHEGARKIIREHLDELYVRDEEATLTSRPGLNLPVYQAGSIAGVIGITGRYEDVAGYGQIVKKMVEILIRENAEQDERRMGQRVLNRFLEDGSLEADSFSPEYWRREALRWESTFRFPEGSWCPASGTSRNMHPLLRARNCWSRQKGKLLL